MATNKENSDYNSNNNSNQEPEERFFLFTYSHNNKVYHLEITAANEQEAKEHIQSIAKAHLICKFIDEITEDFPKFEMN